MIVGRESELEALATFLDDVPAGPSMMLLEGEPGIGKSTLWNEGLEEAGQRGFRILVSRPTGSEAELSFVGLGDLLREVPSASFDDLPVPQREGLEIAVLRRQRGTRRPSQHSVSVAFWQILREIATDRPLIAAIDDLQWLDRATARVLWFAVRRFADEPIGLLLARSPVGEPLPPGIGDTIPMERIHRLPVAGLEPHDLAALVHARTGNSLSVPEARRLAEISGGNPFFALEIVEAASRGDRGVTGQSLPIPRHLRDDVVRERLGTLPVKGLEILLVAAAAARPSLELLRAALGSQGLRTSLQRTIDVGILEVVGPDVRFTHPLYRSAIYVDASRARRHEIHRRLADLVTDPEERAHHLALSADTPDERLAETLGRAAALARDRGAPDASAELLEHAIRLTPPGSTGLARLHLEAAHDRFAAGDPEAAGAHAHRALELATTGTERAAARGRIAGVELHRGEIASARATLDAARAEPWVEPGVSAELLRDLARLAIRSGDLLLARQHAGSALEHAERSGDAASELAARTTIAEIDLLLGHPRIELPQGGSHRMAVPEAAELVVAQAEMFEGRHASARGRLEALLARAAERGDEPARRTVLGRLAELDIRDGSWGHAAELAESARTLARQLDLPDALELGLLAFALAIRGVEDDARSHAALGLEASGEDRLALLWNLGALGELELSLGQHEQAVRYLGRAGGIATAIGLGDPIALPFLADEAEALVRVGEVAAAEERIAWLEERGERLGRTAALAALARCRGLLRAERGDPSGALAELERAVRLSEGLPFEHARDLLELGVQRRRERQKRPAREALERALELFTGLGAAIWSERARGELARIGGRRALLTELTESEERVARLAASGLTNREIARTLSMSIRTVEGHLSHAYAKLGLRSRTELAVFFQRD